MSVDLKILKIAILSEVYAPSRGGVETVTALLAEEFSHLGHIVTILTSTQSETSMDNGECSAFKVVRKPKCSEKFRVLLSSDLVIAQAGFPIRMGYPLALIRKPILIVRQISKPERERYFRKLARDYFESRGKVCFISRFMAEQEPEKSPDLIANPFDDDVFNETDCPEIRRDIIFVTGHFGEAKGYRVFLQALGYLKAWNVQFTSTVIGGRDLPSARLLAQNMDLAQEISFIGPLSNVEVSEELKSHRLLVVPSLWEEPFGIIAVEGIACGCEVFVSNRGGLPEAVGGCGRTFDVENPEVLAGMIRGFLEAGPEGHLEQRKAEREMHLRRFRKREVARSYLRLGVALINRKVREL